MHTDNSRTVMIHTFEFYAAGGQKPITIETAILLACMFKAQLPHHVMAGREARSREESTWLSDK